MEYIITYVNHNLVCRAQSVTNTTLIYWCISISFAPTFVCPCSALPMPSITGDDTHYVGPDGRITLTCEYTSFTSLKGTTWLRDGVDVRPDLGNVCVHVCVYTLVCVYLVVLPRLCVCTV